MSLRIITVVTHVSVIDPTGPVEPINSEIAEAIAEHISIGVATEFSEALPNAKVLGVKSSMHEMTLNVQPALTGEQPDAG